MRTSWPTDAQALGAEIRRRRHAAGLTIDQLAARAGIMANYLGSLELHGRDMSLDVLERIAAGLGTSAAEIMGARPLGAAGREVARLYEGAPAAVQAGLTTLLLATGNAPGSARRPRKKPAPPSGESGT